MREGDNALDGKDVHRVLLNRVCWTVHKREVWWVKGENGSSKSTLLSVAVQQDALLNLANAQHDRRAEWKVVKDNDDLAIRMKRPPQLYCTKNVAFVSTELHISMLEGKDRLRTVRELLRDYTSVDGDVQVLQRALGCAHLSDNAVFSHLSFGEQRLVLLVRALASRPRLLILDEPCHGLDREHRMRVARTVDLMCTNSKWDCACIFVTHQEDELPNSVSHRLVLSQGTVLSRGPYVKSVK